MFFMLGLLSFPAFSENFIINGISERKDQEVVIKDSIVRKKSLAIKDKRVYIQIVLDEGARSVTNHKRYKETLYLLPKEIVYDETARCIFYYKNNAEIEVGRGQVDGNDGRAAAGHAHRGGQAQRRWD